MLITYARSSGISTYQDWCEMTYFLTYNIGAQASPNNKTLLGSACHKILEIISGLKQYSQNNPDKDNLVITDDSLGEILVSKKDLYKVSKLTTREISAINLSRASKDVYRYNVQIPDNHTRVGKEVIEHLVELSSAYYSKQSVDAWTTSQFMDVKNFTWIPLELQNRNFNPLFRTIVEPERNFDLSMSHLPWSKYSYEINGDRIEGNFAIKGTIDLITEIEPGVLEVVDWKGLPLDTSIPTPDGWSTIGELKVGDTIFDENGKQIKVMAKSKVSKKKCYKITFDDTSVAMCDVDHLWKKDNQEVVNILDLKVGDKILVAKPLELEHLLLPIDPYVLGMWLGDGRNRGGEISSADMFVFDEIEKRGYKVGNDISCRAEKCQARTVFGLTTELRKLNLLHNKHIPSIYLRASFEQRLDLLRGLMDSDGNANTVRKQAVFTNCRKQLSDDVKELLLTLGQRPNQGNVISHGFGLVTEVYPLHFRPMNINPFLLPRKAERIDPTWGNGISYRRRVESIEEVEEQLTQCINVEGESSTFLCTKNMIPTHNSGRRLNWGTGKVKDYTALKKDPQLLLYFYAMNRLYGDKYPEISFTIYFIRDGGPYTIDFDKTNISRMEDSLKEHFESVKSNQRPKMLDYNQKNFRCNKLCHFYKNNWEGTDKNMCKFIHGEIDRVGIKKTIELYQIEGFGLDRYHSPGE